MLAVSRCSFQTVANTGCCAPGDAVDLSFLQNWNEVDTDSGRGSSRIRTGELNPGAHDYLALTQSAGRSCALLAETTTYLTSGSWMKLVSIRRRGGRYSPFHASDPLYDCVRRAPICPADARNRLIALCETDFISRSQYSDWIVGS